MRILRIASVVLVVGALSVAGSLYAQDKKKQDDKKDGKEITLPMRKGAKLSPSEMMRNVEKSLETMRTGLKNIVKLQKIARKQKDVIKLNCVNDKLLQVKQHLNIAEAARTNLTEAIERDNENDRYHQYSQVTITRDNVRVLGQEARDCVGDELSFVGPMEIEIDKPGIPDDPTKTNPFNIVDGPDIERPAFASPYI